MTCILLVDDVDLFLELERTFLKRFGCEIVIARTGREALDRVRDRRPDAILLDAVMPEMDGYETCKTLKSDPSTREIPVIFVAGDPDLRRMAEAGGDDLVSKPIRQEALLEVLRRHVHIVERDAERIPVSLRVRLEGHRRSLFSKDLSKGGMFLKAVPPLPVGRKVELRFRLPSPEGPQEVHISGEVVRQVAKDPESHLIAGVGVRFLDIPATERARVSRFVRARLTQQN